MKKSEINTWQSLQKLTKKQLIQLVLDHEYELIQWGLEDEKGD